jgi:hypothetical protein
MKKFNTLLLIAFITISSFFSAQPKLTFSESKQLLVLDDAAKKGNTVELKANFVEAGTKKISPLWTISGVKGKDWVFIIGDEKSENPTVQFNKIGTFSVSLTFAFSRTKTLKDGTEEVEEDELSVEKENLITVTNNLDELTQIYADSNFVKLVKKASDYVVKPKYAGDPTPSIFLAKGYYGMYRKDIKDPAIAEPYDEAIAATAAAMELDLNGVFNTPIHKIWLSKFQNEVLNNSILFNLDEENNYPLFYSGSNVERNNELNSKMVEGIEQYLSITKNQISGKFLEAAIKFNAKDAKTAATIWKDEISNLMKIENLDHFTDSEVKALKVGVILSAQMLQKKDGNTTEACKLLNKVEPWFGSQKDFYSFYEKAMNKCGKQ